MTSPTGNEGDAFIEFHADTRRVEPEARRGVKRAADNVERDLDVVGEDWGEVLANSLGDEIEDQAPEISRKLGRGLGKQKVVTKIKVELDRDNNVIRRLVERTTSEIEDAFEEASRPGGPLSKFGMSIADAVGALFNISGRSPLILLLIPVLFSIVGLILAAVQAANALVAVFATLPAVLAAVGLQVGVLLIAFNGVGTAIQGAFAAKNAKELREALKDLTPAAQDFVKSLLPLRDIFGSLRVGIQENFFRGFGNIVPQIIGALGPNLPLLNQVALALGKLFNTVLEVFGSPTFVEFFQAIVPSIVRFLGNVGPGLNTLLLGLTNMSTALIPFLDKLGQGFGTTLLDLGNFFFNLAGDPGFQQWLDDMMVTLSALGDLLQSVLIFVGAFATQLNAAGGNQLITALTEAVNVLTAFFMSPVGKKALEGLIHLAIIAIQSIVGTLIILGTVFAAIEVVAEWLKNTLWPFIRDTLGPGIGRVLESIGRAVVNFISGMWTGFLNFLKGVVSGVAQIGESVINNVRGWGTRLFEAGKAIVSDLIRGIRAMFGPLAGVIEQGMRIIGRFMPGSPADEGPLSGSGYSMLRGKRLMEDFAKGMASQQNLIRNTSGDMMSQVTVGNGAVVINYQGPLPTEDQMTRFGRAAGSGLANIIAARNTRLAVRTL